MTAPPGRAPALRECRLPWSDSDVQAARFHLVSLGMSEGMAMSTIDRLADEGVRSIRRCVTGWDKATVAAAMERTIAAQPKTGLISNYWPALRDGIYAKEAS